MVMEKRMVNGHSQDSFDDYFTAIEIHSAADSSASSSSSTSSFVTPCKLLPSAIGVGGGGLSRIEHRVSKFDTLAGVAIKYGVEVADIKKMNGLATDHQMFALKTLHIPSPGRHPPSPILNNGVDDKRPSSYERTPPGRRHSDLFDSLRSLKLESPCQLKASPAMKSLQGYDLKQPAEEKVHPEGYEMAVYSKKGFVEDWTSTKSATPTNLSLSLSRKCKSVDNGFYSDNGDLATQEAKDNDCGSGWIEKFVRRRPKSEIGLKYGARDTLLKEENNSGGFFLALASKGLALRPKAGNKSVSEIDAEGGFPTFLADPLLADNNGVKKSYSTPSFQESENGTPSSSSSSSSLSFWQPFNWSLKPDLQAFSTAAIGKPIFDGLPLPISGRKSKAARD